MTQFWSGTATPTATGIVDIPCGFQPVAIEVTASGISGTDNVSHYSNGVSDKDGFQSCDSIYHDTTGGRSVKSITKLVSMYSRVSSNITEVNYAVFSSFYATGAKIDVKLVTTPFRYTIKLWG